LVVEDVDFTAVDGPALPIVRPSGVWPWIVVALGAAIVVVGGILLGSGSHDHPAVIPASSTAVQEH
jgi:hypothetical protein